MSTRIAGLATIVAFAVFVSEGEAVVVQATPTWPVANAVNGQPPIPSLPVATAATPPADDISDPVTPGAACGDWYLQSSYANRWPTGSTWWEYRCSREETQYYTTCTGYACNAFCPECYWETKTWDDYFYWDGSTAVFYGEAYSDSVVSEGDLFPPSSSTAWWDAPTARWYSIPTVNAAPTASFTFSCSGLTCALDASASSDSDGTIVDYRWAFDDGTAANGITASHAYASEGTYNVTLTVTDDGGASGVATKTVTVIAPNVPPAATFTFSCTGLVCSFSGSGSDSDGTIASLGWEFGDGAVGSGATASHMYDHSGTYHVSLTVTDDRGASTTVSQDVAVTNLAPTAAFTISCSSLHCVLDASPSADRDGKIATYSWSFGDGTGESTAATPTTHDYPKAGTYTVTLTVTDNAGASASASQRSNPISLSARGYRQSGQQKVDLGWNGVAGSTFAVYRNGAKIATVSTTAYTDTVPKGTYKYKVCDAGSATCSNEATVSF